MESNTSSIKAVIKPKSFKIFMVVWYVVLGIITVLTSLPQSDTVTTTVGNITVETTLYRVLTFIIYTSYDVTENYGNTSSGGNFYAKGLIGVFILLVLVLIPLFLYLFFYNNKFAKRCSLEMSEKGICGNLKTPFVNKELNLPIDKIDNVMVSESIIDILRGGKTVGVRSASGVVKFPWVRNANEFVNFTLAKIDEFKKNAPEKPSAAPVQNVQNIPLSSADELAKFKQLLDSGTITQEEFDAKKKQLLGL